MGQGAKESMLCVWMLLLLHPYLHRALAPRKSQSAFQMVLEEEPADVTSTGYSFCLSPATCPCLQKPRYYPQGWEDPTICSPMPPTWKERRWQAAINPHLFPAPSASPPLSKNAGAGWERWQGPGWQ